MPSPPKCFRLQAKNIFLTYLRCTLPKQVALGQLLKLSLTSYKKFIRISVELHKNGEPHLHVLIQLEGKVQIYNDRLFDLVSPTRTENFHPNIQGVKSSLDVQTYIEKDGDYIDWGEFQIDGRSSRDGKQDLADVYAEALNSSSKTQTLQTIKEKDPKSYVLQFQYINTNFDRIFVPPKQNFISKWDYSSFLVTDSLKLWVEINFESDTAARPNVNKFILRRQLGRPMSLIIEGPSRMGKTAWACSLGKHNYLSGHLDFNLKVFSNDAEYNIIDDMSPAYLKLKHWKELIGAQHDWQSNYKYGKTVQIKGGIHMDLPRPLTASTTTPFQDDATPGAKLREPIEYVHDTNQVQLLPEKSPKSTEMLPNMDYLDETFSIIRQLFSECEEESDGRIK